MGVCLHCFELTQHTTVRHDIIIPFQLNSTILFLRHSLPYLKSNSKNISRLNRDGKNNSCDNFNSIRHNLINQACVIT